MTQPLRTSPAVAFHESTSLARTYRYLRLATAGTVVAIFVAVLAAVPVVGILPSISHYFYTPARTVFVGALIAASLALFALSGHGVERALLDAAALLAPLIAIVPTGVAAGAVPGVGIDCVEACVPSAYRPDVDNGVLTYLVIGAVVLAVAVVLAALGEIDRATLTVTLAVCAAILAVVWMLWAWAPEFFLAWGHVGATAGFFALIATVSLTNALSSGEPDPPARWLRIAYVVLAAALVTDLVVLGIAVAVADSGAFPIVLIGEALALSLFLAFWVLQSIQKWSEPNPSFR